ncbi:aminoglycoside phosphotransferase (APT) family kinase protein [Streptacidiphilus sp. MAP12-16]
MVRAPEAVYDDLVNSVRRRVVSTGGFHNRNYRVRLTPEDACTLGLGVGTSLLLRVRRSAPELLRVRRPTSEMVWRIWPNESAVLRVLEDVRRTSTRGRGVDVPQVLHTDPDGTAVLIYVEGWTLADRVPAGAIVPASYVDQIARFFAQLVRFERQDLPPLPKPWAPEGDSSAFMGSLVQFAQTKLADAHRDEFGWLLRELGVGDDAMSRFGAGLPKLQGRPFSLLHTDVHRQNIVIDTADRLRVIDWEHAMFGDPLYDLATHLCRMRYPAAQERQVIAAWRDAVTEVSPAHAFGLERDLKHYLAYERAQSVYPDVIRAALTLGVAPDESTFTHAVKRIEAALATAAPPLGLTPILGCDVIRKLLLEWHRQWSVARVLASQQAT